MADLATIIPVEKKVLLSSLFGGEKEIKTFIEGIYLLGYKILLEPK
jgi:predicted RNA-binding protein